VKLITCPNCNTQVNRPAKHARFCSEKCKLEKRSSRRRVRQLRDRYGLSIDLYNDMLRKQECCCAVCRVEDPGGHGSGKKQGWHVDHDHTTGKVRGLLCYKCNHAQGLLITVEIATRLVDYLRHHQKEGTHV
jgi:hypothetical protein